MSYKATELLPDGYSPLQIQSSKRPWRRMAALLLVVAYLSMTMIGRSISIRSDTPLSLEGICEQPQPAALPSNLSRFTDEPGFALKAAKRLAGAVQIATM